ARSPGLCGAIRGEGENPAFVGAELCVGDLGGLSQERAGRLVDARVPNLRGEIGTRGDDPIAVGTERGIGAPVTERKLGHFRARCDVPYPRRVVYRSRDEPL